MFGNHLAVNSVTHLWGYRYEVADSSRNNWVIGITNNGEGWHNNHHALPRVPPTVTNGGVGSHVHLHRAARKDRLANVVHPSAML
jgi:hypothetical protein